jgi:hypothetical protein
MSLLSLDNVLTNPRSDCFDFRCASYPKPFDNSFIRYILSSNLWSLALKRRSWTVARARMGYVLPEVLGSHASLSHVSCKADLSRSSIPSRDCESRTDDVGNDPKSKLSGVERFADMGWYQGRLL